MLTLSSTDALRMNL